MKKIYILLTAVIVSSGILFGQQTTTGNLSEVAPGFNSNNPIPTPQTPWQLLFSYDITAGGSGAGYAGVVAFGSEFWVSRWANDTIANFSITGTLISKFTIPGVTGVRSMTTDGTYIYAGANTASIFKIDPVTRTLVSTIAVSGVPNVRYCTYDASLPGFWVGTYATDFSLVNMSGVIQSSVLATSHLLTATYGLALDNVSPNGPFLWAAHQTQSPSNLADLIQVNVASGMQTAVIHNVTSDIGVGGDLAGGIFIIPTPLTLIGVLQATPSNLLYSYDIAGLSSANEINNEAASVSAYPNPSTGMVNIHVKRTNNDPMEIQIFDVTGKVVFESNEVGMNNLIDISAFTAGIYSVTVTGKNGVYSTELVKN